jgi:very-short-patch-repair endonuclease
MRLLARRFAAQYGVASRQELRSHGITARVEQQRVARGEWERPTRRVVRVAASPRSPEQDLMIAVLEVGPTAVASHTSAAWLWGMARPPDRHEVTVGRHAGTRPGPFVVHRLGGEPPQVSLVRRIPATNPLRTLVDLAAVVSGPDLDDSLDRAVAERLLTVDALQAELDRVARKGRDGAGALRTALRRRGLAEGPHPSVLEARLHRLLRSGGITPMAVEVIAGPDGGYRIDTLLHPRVAVEVDGHRYHSTPEQKAYDERRRTEIRMEGVFLLVYDWRAVTGEGRRVLAECHRALALHGTRRLAD